MTHITDPTDPHFDRPLPSDITKPKIVRVVQETGGLAWYRVDVDLIEQSAQDEHSWPEMDNTDTEIVEVELKDGRVFTRHPDEGEFDIDQLTDLTGIDIYSDEQDGESLYDTIWELACNAKPAIPDPAPPIVIVTRDPDFSNEFAVFGGAVETINIDLGYSDLRHEGEFNEWAENLRATHENLTHAEAKAYIRTTVAETAANHDHAVPRWTVEVDL